MTGEMKNFVVAPKELPESCQSDAFCSPARPGSGSSAIACFACRSWKIGSSMVVTLVKSRHTTSPKRRS